MKTTKRELQQMVRSHGINPERKNDMEKTLYAYIRVIVFGQKGLWVVEVDLEPGSFAE